MLNVKGVARKADKLGRICLPKELRRTFNIETDTRIEIYPVNGKIVLEVIKENCIFCESEKELCQYSDNLICNNCIKNVKSLKN